MLTHSSRLPLSPREQEILLLAADGMTDKQICGQLEITQSTINTYWSRLRDKLGASSRSEAVAKALSIAYQDRIEELHDAQLWMQLFINAAVDYAIFITDVDGFIQSWNPGVHRILGYLEEEFVGQNIELVFTPTDLEYGAPKQEREIASEYGRSLDNRWHVRKDGVRIWCAGSLLKLTDNGPEPKWFAKILRDDTDRKQMEIEMEAIRDQLKKLVEDG
jgi:PAS domain S-box-containing protein